jgi:L-malate glycosyltransferase
MNILLLTHIYPDNLQKWRGVFVQEQAKALSIDNKVIVVFFKANYTEFAPFKKYSFSKMETGNLTEYEVVVSKSLPVITQLKYLINTYSFIKQEIFRNNKIDVIHSHLSYPAGFLGVLIQGRKRIPNVITEHSWIKKHSRSRIHKFCVLYALKKSAAVIAVSDALKDNILSYIFRDIKVIPNLIDTSRFYITIKKKTDSFNIGILGGMSNYRKGLDILLNAVSLIKDLDFTIHIGGDGTLLDKFKDLARDLGIYEKCRFYGEIPAENVPSFFSKLDIFILASRDETFGVVIIEAMAAGLPVIATDCGGPKGIITKENGLLIPAENPAEMASAICQMTKNIQDYNPEVIREYAVKHFGQETVSANIIALYKETILNYR